MVPEKPVPFEEYIPMLLVVFCSAWLRLKLNTKMGFKHHHHPPPPPPPGTFSKGSRLSRVLRSGM